MKQNEPLTIYNTVAKTRSTSGNTSDGFEQKQGYSMKSGYRSDSGITFKKPMTAEEIAKVREAWTKTVLPNVPEEKIPSLIESIKPFDKPLEQTPSLIDSIQPFVKPVEQIKEVKKKIKAEKKIRKETKNYQI